MLIDEKMFHHVEEMLLQNGKLPEFEAQCGKIKGRMMITETQIPDGFDIKGIFEKTPKAFEASFDFYDTTVGLAIDMDTRTITTDLWITPQKEGASSPAKEWIEFFIEKLIESFEEDGSYGMPIYSFINDNYDMTITPSKP